MKVLFYLGHPAHFHLFKNLFQIIKEANGEFKIAIKSKDVLENLLSEAHLEYQNIHDKDRSKTFFNLLINLWEKDFRLFKIAKRYKPDILIGTSIEITHIGKILGIPSIVVNEDDADVVPQFAKLGYRLATKIVAPNCCRVGKWQNKKSGYEGFHELAYLHPQYFTPSKKKVLNVISNNDKYFIIRFSALNAYHDKGKGGINFELAREIIRILRPYGEVFITSEQPLIPQLEEYRIKIKSSDMHDFIAFSTIFIGDSQTMIAEAAVLGVPALRFNDFAGRIGYLEQLENEYKLTFGFNTNESEKLIKKLNELLNDEELDLKWKERRRVLLEKTIDLNQFIFQNAITILNGKS